MNKISTTIISFLCLMGAARAQESRWITFKTGHNEWGAILYQIDRDSIRQEGAYKIFWTRIWLNKKQQAMVFNRNEALIFLSQKFAVDCTQRRFGSRFIDSNEPAEMKHKTSLQTMRWETLDKVPAMGRAVCGDK
jgi:hypothetical protein